MQLVIITGATRGFGRSLALSFSRLSRSKDIHFVLSGRDVSGLHAAKAELLACRAAVPGCVPGCGEIRVDVVVADLADMDALPAATEQLLLHIPTAATGESKYDSAVLVNNAGSLGELACLGLSGEPDGSRRLRSIVDNMNLNVSSTIHITSEFIRKVAAAREGGCMLGGTTFIVNVSSLCAVQPFDSWGLYCTGKVRSSYPFTLIASLFFTHQCRRRETCCTLWWAASRRRRATSRR